LKSNIPGISPNNKVEPTGALSNQWFSSPWLLFIIGTGLLAGLAIAKYNSLHTTIFDLGIFLNNFRNIAEGHLWLAFSGHVQPLMPAVALIYKILPHHWFPGFILLFQSAALMIPLVGIHRHYGVIPALAFVLYFPLWYNALFDFHMDHLAVPLLFGFFFLERSGRIGLAMVPALLLALVKEPFALQTAACGLYLLLIRKQRMAGTTLILSGLFYFVFVTQYILPYFTIGEKGGLDSPVYSWLGDSPADMIWFIITKPHLVLGEIFSDNGKISYLLYVFGALGLIPFLQPGILLIAFPVLAISLLSMHPGYYGYMHHYTAGLVAPAIIAFAEGLPIARKVWERVSLPIAWFTPLLLVFLIVFHFITAPSPVSRLFWNPNSWAYNATAYLPTNRDSMIKEAILAHIPSNPDIAVSAQNSINWGYLANRKYYFAFPFGVLQPHKVPKGSDKSMAELLKFINSGELTPAKTEEIWVDYVLLDQKKPWFIIDNGCPWENGQCKNKDAFSSKFLALVQQTKERFDSVFEKDGFYILKRKNL